MGCGVQVREIALGSFGPDRQTPSRWWSTLIDFSFGNAVPTKLLLSLGLFSLELLCVPGDKVGYCAGWTEQDNHDHGWF